MTADRLTEDVAAIREALWLLKGAAPMGTIGWFPDALARLDNVAAVVSQLQDVLQEWANRYGDCVTAGALGTLTDYDNTMLARAEKRLLELAASFPADHSPAPVLLPPPE